MHFDLTLAKISHSKWKKSIYLCKNLCERGKVWFWEHFLNIADTYEKRLLIVPFAAMNYGILMSLVRIIFWINNTTTSLLRMVLTLTETAHNFIKMQRFLWGPKDPTVSSFFDCSKYNKNLVSEKWSKNGIFKNLYLALKHKKLLVDVVHMKWVKNGCFETKYGIWNTSRRKAKRNVSKRQKFHLSIRFFSPNVKVFHNHSQILIAKTTSF